jgi:hypothetical protein
MAVVAVVEQGLAPLGRCHVGMAGVSAVDDRLASLQRGHLDALVIGID